MPCFSRQSIGSECLFTAPRALIGTTELIGQPAKIRPFIDGRPAGDDGVIIAM